MFIFTVFITIERGISLTNHLSQINMNFFTWYDCFLIYIYKFLYYNICKLFKEALLMNKKLQVFVSSTYTDLIKERQAAVQAILDAGHIPAGMELFKAGNESQLKTIYKWIDESDVYMLILGGRYGSIEPKSGKSYTQLEYEYALNKNVPVFSVVLSQCFLTSKINSLGLEKTIESDNPDKYKSFKDLVMSKIIKNVDDYKDIKIAIHSTLNEFIHNYALTGWTRNNKDINQLVIQNKKLLEENNTLNKQLHELKTQIKTIQEEYIGNISFSDLYNIFINKKFKIPPNIIDLLSNKTVIERVCQVKCVNFFDFLWRPV